MFQGMATTMYKMHYHEGISPHLILEDKETIAKRISDLTLRSAIWMDRETDYIEQFPELAPYVNARLTGLYLCAIMSAIVEEIREKAEGEEYK